MATDERKALSEELLAEWRKNYAEPHNTFPGDKWTLIAIIRALLADDDRLRAELAAQGKLVELLAAEAWHGHNAPYYAEMRRILEAHKHAWYTIPKLEK